MTRRAAPAVLLLLAGAATLSGCAQPVKVQGEWQEGVPRDQSFERVLVVGVSPDYNQRCAFEGFVANQVRSEATTVFTSCRVLSSKEPLTRENVERAIAERNADAVLATFLIAAEVEASEGGSSETRGDGYYKPTGFDYETGYYGGYGAYRSYGVYGVPVVYGEFRTAPPITTVQGSVEIASRLYETAGATLVYELVTTAHDLESRAGGLAEVSGAIADRLRKDGLVR
ncbi:hypothetical protein [Thioalkalivibrio sp. XN279]|uniref:hypothetical protein n=1 Tax=Thioalkalivibrio sp. XN279 TaxID=2714953 RepID=UPI00140E58E0|nr:hypothetical protein [Thioalkalivibrio sp. XN279]NHA13486.1 hypothetical protein [Thioalkalivibrio sp. XN279]